LLHIPLGVDFAQALWNLLLPHGFSGGALAHVPLRDSDNDSNMDGEEGFKEEYITWWFEFLAQKGYKGVSKDTWAMVRCFLSLFFLKKNRHPSALWPPSLLPSHIRFIYT